MELCCGPRLLANGSEKDAAAADDAADCVAVTLPVTIDNPLPD